MTEGGGWQQTGKGGAARGSCILRETSREKEVNLSVYHDHVLERKKKKGDAGKLPLKDGGVYSRGQSKNIP